MKELRKYDIQFHGLGLGVHDFEYKIDKTFFDLFQFTEAEDYSLSVKLNLEKRTTFVGLDFLIEGTMEFPCDLCIELFDLPFRLEKRQLIKFGQEEYNQTEEIDIIPLNSNYINVAKYIYEFVILAMPTKRIHGKGLCNEEMLKKIQTYKLSQSKESNSQEESDTDPRWDNLKKLRY